MNLAGADKVMKILIRAILGSFLLYVWVLICNATASFLQIAYGGIESIPVHHAGGLTAGFLTGVGFIVYHSVGKNILQHYRTRKEIHE